jgi:phage terminase Nu1 subunit (DNA packaging protein)
LTTTNPEVLSLAEVRKANKAQAALFFGITLPVIDKWIREGMPIVQRGSKGFEWVLDLHDIAKWKYTARLPSGELDPETLAPGERKLWYDGETKRRELQVRDRQLIPALEVEEVVGTAFSATAQALMALPDNLERRAGLSPEQVESVDTVIHEALNDLADKLGHVAPIPNL